MVRDDEGFDAFARSSGGRLLRVAEMLSGDRSGAEDLLQIAFSRLYPRWGRVDDPYAFTRRVLVNLRNDRWRRLRPERVGPVPDRQVADRADETDRRLLVLSALAGLTARERGVLVLRYFEDLSEADIAQVLGVAPGTVKSTASRALGKLRDSGRLADLAPTCQGGNRVRLRARPRPRPRRAAAPDRHGAAGARSCPRPPAQDRCPDRSGRGARLRRRGGPPAASRPGRQPAGVPDPRAPELPARRALPDRHDRGAGRPDSGRAADGRAPGRR